MTRRRRSVSAFTVAERGSERAALLAGLRELGWIEGTTVAIEYRSAKWNVELLDELAEELVRMKVDVIVATGSAPLRAAKQATTNTSPIVMTGSADPVAHRLIASLARPGGNVTGMSFMVPPSWDRSGLSC